MQYRGIRLLPLFLASLVLAGCSAPESSPGAETPETLTTTVTSGEETSESSSSAASSITSAATTLQEVDATEFEVPIADGTVHVWRVVMRGGELHCEVINQGELLVNCAVKDWKDAPRSLAPTKDYFGAASNRIELTRKGGFAPSYKAPGVNDILGSAELKAGKTTTIEGYTFSVDNNDVVTVKSTGGWFTFDGSLTTQDWTQGVQSNGWADPGNVCKRDKGPAGDDRVFFAGKQGANCEANLEAFAKYGEALKNPVPGGYGSGQIVQKDGWGCSASEFHAEGTSGADRKETCAVDGQGGIWVTDPTSYPADL